MLGVPRLRQRRARARPHRAGAPRSRRPTTCCSVTDWPSQAMRSRPPRTHSASRSTSYPVDPATDDRADVDAARRVDAMQNRIFLDPLLRGRYPEDLRRGRGPDQRHGDRRRGRREDHQYAAGRARDQLLHPACRSAPPERRPTSARAPSWVGSADVQSVDRGLPKTEMGWEIDPQGLYDVLERVHREYGPIPLYITENGAAFADQPGPDGDGRRPATGGLPRRPLPGRPSGDRRGYRSSRLLRRGLCSTTSNGRGDSPSGSGWSTSTTRPGSASRRTAPAGSPTSPAATAL